MIHGQEFTLQERVNQYLSKYSVRSNAFVAAAETAEAAHAAREAGEAELNEYLVKRAEQELRAAQDKLDTLLRKIEEGRLFSTSPISH